MRRPPPRHLNPCPTGTLLSVRGTGRTHRVLPAHVAQVFAGGLRVLGCGRAGRLADGIARRGGREVGSTSEGYGAPVGVRVGSGSSCAPPSSTWPQRPLAPVQAA